MTDRTLTIRPLRTRAGGPAEIVIPWGAIYVRALADKIAADKAARRTRRRRAR